MAACAVTAAVTAVGEGRHARGGTRVEEEEVLRQPGRRPPRCRGQCRRHLLSFAVFCVSSSILQQYSFCGPLGRPSQPLHRDSEDLTSVQDRCVGSGLLLCVALRSRFFASRIFLASCIRRASGSRFSHHGRLTQQNATRKCSHGGLSSVACFRRCSSARKIHRPQHFCQFRVAPNASSQKSEER